MVNLKTQLRRYKYPLLLISILLGSFITTYLYRSYQYSHVSGPHHSSEMSITHIVLFQFKTGTDAGAIREAEKGMLGLKDECIHPTSKKPYILSLKGGTDNSPEGMQDGLTHAFIVEFASPEDRDYYVKTDPAHQAFVKSVGPIMEKARVVDFTAGVF